MVTKVITLVTISKLKLKFWLNLVGNFILENESVNLHRTS